MEIFEKLKNQKGLFDLIILIILLASVMLPWLDINFTAKSKLYNIDANLIYESNALGQVTYRNISYINGTEVSNYQISYFDGSIFNSYGIFAVIAIILFLIQFLFYLLDIGSKISDIRALKLVLEGKGELPPLLQIISAVFMFIAVLIFIKSYPNFTVVTESGTHTINEFVTIATQYAVNFPYISQARIRRFSYKPGLGFELALVVTILIVFYYVFSLFKFLNFRRTIRLRLAVLAIEALIFVSPIAIYQVKDSIKVVYGYNFGITTNILLVTVIIIAIAMVFRFILEGKFLIMDVQFLSLDLPPDEYRRRVNIVNKYSPYARLFNI